MEKCPCQSSLSYSACCSPFVQHQAKPNTAEQLMRSRYTAYVLGNVDYLEQTHHPKTRREFDKAATAKMQTKVTWLSLEVIDLLQGMTNDIEGYVEFKASYRVNGVRYTLHEKSHFVKEQADWLYVNGVMPTASNKTNPKFARNAPCPCKSGKKYKKCCGV